MEPGAESATTDPAAEQGAARTLSEIAARKDFLATGDPALQEGVDRGNFQLLDYDKLYALWERQHWATQDLDFSRDRIDWHERISPEERFERMYGLSAFFIGEQRVTDELGPIMRAAPSEEMRIFLSTQIADEARHVRFFNRFYAEVGVLEGADGLGERLRASEENLNDDFGRLFDEMLKERVDRLAAEPEDLVALVEAITLYHMVIEGVLALTGQHFIIGYNEEQGTLPAFVKGFNNVARDEHRHVAFGAKFLTDMAADDVRYREAIQRMLVESLPIAEGVLRPPFAPEDDEEEFELFGVSMAETQAFAAQCLTRRLKVIGLAT
ncbi:MAG: ribonucleotide reductase [Geminicoccaceae bacterium]|jgi:ribonucleoside-diphosphate reductase beta chain|nr:ribonucleotide reductase [Geminicoccaceae bacterium]MCE3246436.1 ribonucleotide reductase [Geminicoccaceae bacterium]